MDNWALVNLQVNEAQRISQKERLEFLIAAANKLPRSTNKQSLRQRFDALKGKLLCYGESFYCRTLSFINSRVN